LFTFHSQAGHPGRKASISKDWVSWLKSWRRNDIEEDSKEPVNIFGPWMPGMEFQRNRTDLFFDRGQITRDDFHKLAQLAYLICNEHSTGMFCPKTYA